MNNISSLNLNLPMTCTSSRKSNSISHTRGRRDLGQALLELTLLLPIFLLLLIGTVEFGRLAYASIEVADAARAGVQYGAQSNTAAANNAAIQQAATYDAPDIKGLTAVATHTCKCSSGAASANCLASDCATGTHLVEWVQVNTTAVVDPLFHLPGLPNIFTLKGQAIMRVTR